MRVYESTSDACKACLPPTHTGICPTARPITTSDGTTSRNRRPDHAVTSHTITIVAMIAMRSHLALFARYGLPNAKATQLVRDLTMTAFTPKRR